MVILSEQEMDERISFVSPLHPKQDEPESIWCIPFGYAGLHKSTRISKSKAKVIVAELTAAIAESDKRELQRAFDVEKERSVELAKQLSAASEELFQARAAILLMKRKRKAKVRP